MIWLVQNHGAVLLEITSLRLPHGQFKSDEQRFEPPISLAPGQSDRFDSMVQCSEPAGLVTENAFVILYTKWLGADWRIYVRMRVTINSNMQPVTATELITTQKVGFSKITE